MARKIKDFDKYLWNVTDLNSQKKKGLSKEEWSALPHRNKHIDAFLFYENILSEYGGTYQIVPLNAFDIISSDAYASSLALACENSTLASKEDKERYIRNSLELIKMMVHKIIFDEEVEGNFEGLNLGNKNNEDKVNEQS